MADKDKENEIQILHPDEILFRQGEASHSLILVKEGEIEIYIESGDVKVVLGTMLPGDVIGTVTLFSAEPRTANARATKASMVQIIPSDSARKSLTNVPAWMQSVVKDTVARLCHVNNELMITTKHVRSLEKNVDDCQEKGAKLAALLFAMARVGSVDFEGEEVYPLKSFTSVAEGVLGSRAEQIDLIFKSFIKSGLVKQFASQKYGQIVKKARIGLLEDFAVFVRNLGRNPERLFIPAKYQFVVAGLSKIAQTLSDKGNWDTDELQKILSKQTGREVSSETILALQERHVLVDVPGCQGKSVTFNAASIAKRSLFEETWRLLKDLEKVAQAAAA